ncbi:hypothetical protein SAMN05443634_1176 [Chishuiella changwenlii]|uniref:Uncharacterized protein n=1 Tax=Chishuiella changwenlii TaxID=1434701 RepID=A0A1M7D1Z9_9FLAO|nr:hypothetical protein [Chishuiella changwenlii]GGF10680.1 hypothetical protein GCM10010984_29760 [Chishuiella changwenlii]SHL73465.1 hypothetical protein SAMN05443634_1176 [Chishuiella changwenlii]
MKKIYFLLGLISNIALAQLATPSAQIIATTNPTTGNVGIGINNPDEKLSVERGISVSQNSDEGGYLSILNTRKSGDSSLTWRIYNMTGAYGNSLQFWNYTNDWRGGSRLILSDNGNIGIGTETPKAKLDINGFVIMGGHETNLDVAVGNPNKIKDAIANSGKVAIGWNLSGGKGEASFISNRGQGGTGGFSFYDIDNSGTINHILNLNSNGNAVLYGKFEAKEIKVTESPTADFVFEEDYKLPTLQEVEQHIKEKKHLPEIASAKQMEKEGVNIGEFQIQLLQKIEELTLYIIEQNKEIEEQNNRIKKLEKIK